MYLFIFLSTVYKSFLYSTSLPAFVIFCHFDNRHLDRCEMISYFFLNFIFLMISRLPWHLSRWESTFRAVDAGDVDLIPGLGRSPEGGNGNWLWYSCMEKSHGWRSLMGYSPWSCKESDLFHIPTGHLYLLLIKFLCPYFSWIFF